MAMTDFLIFKGLPAVGSFFVFRAVIAVASPKPEAAGLAGVGVGEARQGGPAKGSLAALTSRGGLLENLDYWLVKTLNLELSIDQIHMQLGRPEGLTPVQILHYKEGAVAGAFVFLAVIVDPIAAVVLAPLAFFVPDLVLKGRIQERQVQILGGFPQFVDLSALMIESGADYIGAFDKIVRASRKKSDLELEIEKTIAEVSLGSTRKDALRHFAERIGVQEVRSFVGLIIQSEELGTSLVGLLRDFAADMRFRRLNKAEKMAAQASTKMLIPLIIFIFPTVFILMLGPMVYGIITGGGLPF